MGRPQGMAHSVAASSTARFLLGAPTRSTERTPVRSHPLPIPPAPTPSPACYPLAHKVTWAWIRHFLITKRGKRRHRICGLLPQEFHCLHVRLAWTRRGRAGHATLGSSRDAPPIDGCVTWFCQESLANASSPSPQRAGGRTRPH